MQLVEENIDYCAREGLGGLIKSKDDFIEFRINTFSHTKAVAEELKLRILSNWPEFTRIIQAKIAKGEYKPNGKRKLVIF